MIGAMHGLEWLYRFPHGRAKAFKHGADDMIAPDQDALRLNLCLKMAIAQMPGYLGKVQRIARNDLVKLLLFGNDLDQPAVLQHEAVAMRKHDRFGEIDQHLLSAAQPETLAAQMAFVLRQENGVGGRPGILAAADMGYGAMHVFSLQNRK